MGVGKFSCAAACCGKGVYVGSVSGKGDDPSVVPADSDWGWKGVSVGTAGGTESGGGFGIDPQAVNRTMIEERKIRFGRVGLRRWKFMFAIVPKAKRAKSGNH
jgi:hypothetical protein